MIGLGIGVAWKNNNKSIGGIVFDTDYQAVLDRATTLGYTLPSASQQIIQNNLVLSLKAGGIWTKLDVLYIFANDGGRNFATLNWKAPTLNQSSLIDTPTFTTNQGFEGNGTSSYINTNFNPATSGVNYTQNNASRYIYTLNVVGIFDGIEADISNRLSNTGTTAQRINQGSGVLNSAYTYLSGTGMKSIHRTSSTNVELFSDITKSSRTANSFTITNANQVISRSLTTYSANRVSMYAMGASLVSENTAFVNAFNTYIYNINNLDSDYVAVLNRAITLGYALPTFSQIIKQNQLVVDLKAGGVWNKLDVLYIFANDGGSDFATLNWKSPALYQATLVNSPSFTANQGFVGNGTSSYINANFNPSTDGINYTLDNASISAYLFSAGVTPIAGSSVGDNRLSIGSSAGQYRLNSGSGLNSSFSFNGTGLKSFNRTTSTNLTLFNGLIGENRTATSTILPASSFILRYQSIYGTSRISTYAMGASLVSENTAYVNAINTYVTSL